jgi:alanine racemase
MHLLTFAGKKDFRKPVANLNLLSGIQFIKHLSNSAASFQNASITVCMVRLGIGLFGIDQQ